MGLVSPLFNHYMPTKLTEQQIKNEMEKYTGEKITKVDFVQDPHVDNTWAVRCHMAQDGKMWDFILEGKHTGNPFDSINEVEFKSWPPKSNVFHANFIQELDEVADQLEARGATDLAAAVDKVAAQVQAK